LPTQFYRGLLCLREPNRIERNQGNAHKARRTRTRPRNHKRQYEDMARQWSELADQVDKGR
jgi:hypothetical protein